MAVEHVIDLEHQRYADRDYDGRLPESTMPAEQYQRDRRVKALARLRKRVREPAGTRDKSFLSRTDLVDLLIVIGEEDW
jgi:hypothetical protein